MASFPDSTAGSHPGAAAGRRANDEPPRSAGLLAVMILCSLPSLLVFSDRWLGNQALPDLLTLLWCRLPSACLGPWPATMFLVIPAILGGVILVARRPARRVLLEPALPEEDQASPRPGHIQRQVALVGLVLLGIAMAVVVVWRSAAGGRPAWDYALPYLGFLMAWVLYEIPVRRPAPAALAWCREWVFLFAAHVLLVLALAAWAKHNPAAPVLAVPAVSTHIFLWGTRRRTIPPVFWFISASLVLSSLYMNAWWFSAIGDEYAFYNYAAGLLARADVSLIGAQLYTPSAVYGAHPGFSSLIQAASMAAFGPGLFGWRFSNLYLASLSLWPFFAFAQAFGGRRLAILASALLATSHYLMSFGKIGYNNLQALLAFSVCLAGATWFIRSRGRIAAVAFGAALGLCFFVYPGALLTLPVSLLVAARHRRPTRTSLGRWLITGTVLFATVLPILIQRGFWEAKLPGTFWQDPSLAVDRSSPLVHILSNLGQASLSFLWTPTESHFVAVGFVDVVTAVLVILGMGALLRDRDRRTAGSLLAGLVILLLLVGAMHGYASPPPTRMFLLLPWWAMLGALGLVWLEGSLRDLGVSERPVGVVTCVLLALILVVNLVQAYPLSRQRMAGRYQSPQVLLLRESNNLLVPGSTHARVLILAMPQSPLRDSVARQLSLHQVSFDESSLTEDSAQTVSDRDLRDPRTMVWIAPRVPEALQTRLEARLVAAGKGPCRFRNSIGEVRLVVWTAPTERYRCAEAAYRW